MIRRGDLENRLERDFEKEPTLGQRRRIPLDERGAVRVRFARLEDEDGIDGPFERAFERAMREDGGS